LATVGRATWMPAGRGCRRCGDRKRPSSPSSAAPPAADQRRMEWRSTPAPCRSRVAAERSTSARRCRAAVRCFLGRHARDGRLGRAPPTGDLAQAPAGDRDSRARRSSLPVDDSLGHAQDRCRSAPHVLVSQRAFRSCPRGACAVFERRASGCRRTFVELAAASRRVSAAIQRPPLC